MAAPSDFPAEVELRVKVFDPNARGESKQIELKTTPLTSGTDLKKQIAAHSDVPFDGSNASDMAKLRLIYSGKIFDGKQLLYQVLRKPNPEDGETASFTLQAVLPLQKSTKDRYSHEVNRDNRQERPTGAPPITRVSSAPVTPHVSAIQAPDLRRQQTYGGSRVPRHSSPAASQATPSAPAAQRGPAPHSAGADFARTSNVESPELLAARAAAQVAAARHRARTASSTGPMDELDLGDSASSASSSVDPLSPPMQPGRAPQIPRRVLQTPPLHSTRSPSGDSSQTPNVSGLPHAAPFPGALPPSDNLPAMVEAMRRTLEGMRLQGAVAPGAATPGLFGAHQPASPATPFGVGGVAGSPHAQAMGLSPGLNAFSSPTLPAFNQGLGGAAFGGLGQIGMGLGGPPGNFAYNQHPNLWQLQQMQQQQQLQQQQMLLQQRLLQVQQQLQQHSSSPLPASPASPLLHRGAAPADPTASAAAPHTPSTGHSYPPGLGLTPQMQRIQERMQQLQREMAVSEQPSPNANVASAAAPSHPVVAGHTNQAQRQPTQQPVNEQPANEQPQRGLPARGQAQQVNAAPVNAQNPPNDAVAVDVDVRAAEAALAELEAQLDERAEGPGSLMFRLKLIAKILFVSVILGQNGDLWQWGVLAVLGTLVFLHQDGFLDGILNRNQRRRRNEPVDLRQFQERSVVVGGVSPRDPRRSCFTELAADVMYAFASFFLAVLPWWRPNRNTHLDRYLAEQEEAQRQAASSAAGTEANNNREAGQVRQRHGAHGHQD